MWKRHEEQLRPRLIPADQCIDREVEQQMSDVLGSSQTLLDDVSTSTPYLNTPAETEWEHSTSIPNASTLKSVPKVVEKVPDSAPPLSSPNPPKPEKGGAEISSQGKKTSGAILLNSFSFFTSCCSFLSKGGICHVLIIVYMRGPKE